jgi:hypothetical protein
MGATFSRPVYEDEVKVAGLRDAFKNTGDTHFIGVIADRGFPINVNPDF